MGGRQLQRRVLQLGREARSPDAAGQDRARGRADRRARRRAVGLGGMRREVTALEVLWSLALGTVLIGTDALGSAGYVPEVRPGAIFLVVAIVSTYALGWLCA